MIMVHSDNTGLVLPPKVAQHQVVIIPIIKSKDNKEEILDFAYDQMKSLKSAGVRAFIDESETKNPGAKYAYWEVRGIPLRLEVGQKEVSSRQIAYAKRNDGKKGKISIDDLANSVKGLLDTIH